MKITTHVAYNDAYDDDYRDEHDEDDVLHR